MDRPNDEEISFNFITAETLRASLKSDYREMIECQKSGAIKAVHVLAGSIIETVLVDYLLAVDPSREDKVLKMMLDALVDECKGKILSDKAVNLTAVVRQYRNLIHPGRMRRLGEKITKDGANVAASLVNIIITEIAEQRQKTYGYTAEQIVLKIGRDTSSLPILKHLIEEMQATEKRRLLLKVLPDNAERCVSIEAEDFTAYPVIDVNPRYQQCFRMTFDSVTDPVRREAVSNYARMVREADGRTIFLYETAYFQAADLAYAATGDVKLIKERLFTAMNESCMDGTFRQVRHTFSGFAKHLGTDDVHRFLNSILEAVAAEIRNDRAGFPPPVMTYLKRECKEMSIQVKNEALGQLSEWIGVHPAFGDDESTCPFKARQEIQDFIASIV